MIGSTLSHYKITAELGRGGMGIVYRAEDTKLDRVVAIKVLPSAALASKDDRERFYREAKAAAALNHPHIAQVYEIDEAAPSDAPHGTEPSPFIAMEFIDGRPLDEELKQTPLKLNKAVKLAIQIAQALEAAHDKDIVHRDIKSANVMFTAKGDAKVLDFGLAKTSHSTMLTRMGSTLGTVAYMSPEQARGEEVDHRTDLWALGVVIYEMVTGRNPFGGDYEQAVVYSILNEAPEPLTAVRTGVPMQLEWIVDKCMTKSADARYQSAKDLIVDLKKVDIASGSGTQQLSTLSRQALSSMTGTTATPQTGAPTKPWPWIAAALVLGAILTLGIFTLTKSEPPVTQLIRVDISLPSLSFVRFPTMSPTGEYFAVVALGDDGNKGVYLRTMSTGVVHYVRGSEDAGDREMGFSPDGSRLAFNASANDGLFVVDIPSGIPARITEFGRFAYWESDNGIVMTNDKMGSSESYRVSLDGLEPVKMEEDKTRTPAGYSNVLKTHVPGTKRAFGHQLVRVQGGNQDGSQPANVYSFDSITGDLVVIAKNAINPYYVHPGLLLYQIGDDQGPVVVRPLNDNRTDFNNSPLDVLGQGLASWGDYAPTPDGDLLYLSSGSVASSNNVLWAVDLETQSVNVVRVEMPVGAFPSLPNVSPSGRYLAYSLHEGSSSGNIHLFDLTTDINRQITFENENYGPEFSADGRWLYWTSILDNVRSTYRQPVDGSASAELFIEGAQDSRFSTDGRWVAYSKGQRGNMNLMLRNLKTGEDHFVDSTSVAPFPRSFSPDGRYLSYAEDMSASSTIRIVSVDGKETYSLPGMRGFGAMFTDDGNWMIVEAIRTIYRVPIRIEPSFGVLGAPELLLNAPYAEGFDALGSEKIYISASAVQFSGGEQSQTNMVWLQNWSSSLQREFDQ